MPELEPAGDAMTGGILGRAVEPTADEHDDGHTHQTACLNCGCELVGAYCHCCGQRGHVHRTIAAWWHDFVHSVLHLDGKFWRTLPMLAWRPGELTRRYAHGERAKFISPLALFLFTVFLMFAVATLTGSLDTAPTEQMRTDVEKSINVQQQKIAALEQQRQQLAASKASTSALDDRISEARQELDALQRLRHGGLLRKGQDDSGIRDALGDTPEWLREPLLKARENPELLLYKLQANAYKFSWAVIPISVPFLWILFLHRRRYRQEFTAYDHLVFVTYSIAFMSLMLVAYVVLAAVGVGGPLLELAFLLIPPVHMYRQLRGAYCVSRFGAAWRMFMLLIFAAVALTLFAILLLLLGAFG